MQSASPAGSQLLARDNRRKASDVTLDRQTLIRSATLRPLMTRETKRNGKATNPLQPGTQLFGSVGADFVLD